MWVGATAVFPAGGLGGAEGDVPGDSSWCSWVPVATLAPVCLRCLLIPSSNGRVRGLLLLSAHFRVGKTDGFPGSQRCCRAMFCGGAEEGKHGSKQEALRFV